MGIDPGLRHAGAAYGDAEFLACKAWKSPNGLAPAETALWFRDSIPWTADVCWVEHMVKYPGDAVDANDLLNIQLVGGILAASVAKRAFSVEPREWKGQTPKKICHQRIREKMSRSELIRLDKCLHSMAESEHEHALDATGIWLFAQGRMKRGL